MCIGIDGNIWPFSAEVGAEDLVVLATDGLTDNLHMPEVSSLLPLIVRAQFFDQRDPAVECTVVKGRKAHLPTLAEVAEAVGEGEGLDTLANVLPTTASMRLSNYIRWVTRWMYKQEQEYYATRKHLTTLLQAGSDSKEEIERLESHLKDLTVYRKMGSAGKTDDAMVLVMKPFHNLGKARVRTRRGTGVSAPRTGRSRVPHG